MRHQYPTFPDRFSLRLLVLNICRECNGRLIQDVAAMRVNIYRNCGAGGHARAHFGDVHNHNHNTISEEDGLLRWLSPLSPSGKRNEALNMYQSGTLDWLFDNPIFTSWLGLDPKDESSNVIWCRGDLGTGKSIFASKLEEKLLNDSNGGSVALVYGSWPERSKQTVACIIGSVLAQLYATNTVDIPGGMRQCYRHKTRDRRELDPTQAELETWLTEFMMRTKKPPILILDGLDELEPMVRSDILQILHRSSPSRIKIFITSRFAPDEADTENEPYPYRMIEFRSAERDIKRFITASLNRPAARRFTRLTRGASLKGERHRRLRVEIVSRILVRSSGMYVLAVACNKKKPMSLTNVGFYLRDTMWNASWSVDRLMKSTNA
jgi:hypothetical protein